MIGIKGGLASSVHKVPSGERWIHEVKFDGYGIQVQIREGLYASHIPRVLGTRHVMGE
ncbi:hypothetical protein [Bradyrhizobium sp. URHD0069]|uniref:hypothetical protein n=1 Tax=Bradyrhizobium sp. URHD0069 TaxID=1380355 RepID=UPI000A5944CD|nr:hypothetical protein [Bradyrhizobium sp. URHD0069]